MQKVLPLALVLVLVGCTKTAGPQKLSPQVWQAGRRAAPVFSRADQAKDGDPAEFDAHIAETAAAIDQVNGASCNCSNPTVMASDQTFKDDLRNCLNFLRSYRDVREKVRRAQLKDELDGALREKESVSAVLINCETGIAHATGN